MKITDAMVERGARVLFESAQELDQDNDWDDELPREWRDEWLRTAREVLTEALGPLLSPESKTRHGEGCADFYVEYGAPEGGVCHVCGQEVPSPERGE